MLAAGWGAARERGEPAADVARRGCAAQALEAPAAQAERINAPGGTQRQAQEKLEGEGCFSPPPQISCQELGGISHKFPLHFAAAASEPESVPLQRVAVTENKRWRLTPARPNPLAPSTAVTHTCTHPSPRPALLSAPFPRQLACFPPFPSPPSLVHQ